MIGNGMFSGKQPRQDMTLDEIKKHYNATTVQEAVDMFHLDCVRYGSMFYNSTRTPFNNSAASNNTWWNLGEAERARRNFLYFQGDQQNWDMGYLTQLDGGGEMPAPYVAGKDVRKIVMNASGGYIKLLRNCRPSVTSYDNKVQTKKKQEVKRAMIRFDEAPFFEEIAEQFGIEYNPTFGMEFTSKQDAERRLMRTTTEDAEIYGTEIVNEIKSRNNFIGFGNRTFIQQYVGGRCSAEVSFRDGWPVWDEIPSYLSINSSVEDDDFGNNDEIKGWIRQFSPTQLTSRQGLFAKETWGEQLARKYGEDTLNLIFSSPAEGSPNGTIINGFNGYPFNWWATSGKYISTWTAVRIYWRGLVDSRYVPDKNDPTNKLHYLSADSKKRGEMIEVYRTATVIGNKWVVDEGIADQVRDPLNPKKLYPPILTFQPFTFLGYNRSAVDSIREYQADMDAIDYKSREMMGFDMGQILGVVGAKMSNSQNPFEILEELKKARILLETSSGDMNNAIDNRNAVYAINMSTVDYAIKYQQLRDMKAKMQADALNISDIGLGSQQSYVSNGVQQTSADLQSNNSHYYFWGHMQFMTNLLQYSLELLKVKVAAGETKAAESIVGERGVVFMKEFKKYLYMTLLCRVDIDDFIGEGQRRELVEIIKAFGPQGGMDIQDFAEIINCKTWTELKDYVRWKNQTNIAKAEQRELLDKITSIVNTQTMAKANTDSATISALSKEDMAEQATQAGLAKELIRADLQMDKHGMQQDQMAQQMPQQMPQQM